MYNIFKRYDNNFTINGECLEGTTHSFNTPNGNSFTHRRGFYCHLPDHSGQCAAPTCGSHQTKRDPISYSINRDCHSFIHTLDYPATHKHSLAVSIPLIYDHTNIPFDCNKDAYFDIHYHYPSIKHTIHIAISISIANKLIHTFTNIYPNTNPYPLSSVGTSTPNLFSQCNQNL